MVTVRSHCNGDGAVIVHVNVHATVNVAAIEINEDVECFLLRISLYFLSCRFISLHVLS